MRIIITLALLTCSIGCGGGGGNEGGRDNPAPSKAAPTGVRVLHSALDLSPISISVDDPEGESFLPQSFAQGSVHQKVSPGLHDFQLTIPNILISQQTISLKENERRTILLYGDRENTGLKSTVIVDPSTELNEADAAVRIIHGITGATELSLRAGGENVIAASGTASKWITLPAGEVVGSVRRRADNTDIQEIAFEAKPQTYYSVWVSGEIGLYSAVTLLEEAPQR